MRQEGLQPGPFQVPAPLLVVIDDLRGGALGLGEPSQVRRVEGIMPHRQLEERAGPGEIAAHPVMAEKFSALSQAAWFKS